MIQYLQKNDFKGNKLNLILGKEPYLIINFILAGVISLMLIYFGIFSPVKDNYPVTCLHEKLTGEPCISCGLSHSISLIIRGKFSEAHDWNIYGMRVFLFFFFQFVMRIAFSLFYIRHSFTRKQLIITDMAGSALMFLIAFMPYMIYIFEEIF